MTGIIISSLCGVVTTTIGSVVAWFLSKRKYISEVESTNIENMKKSLDFYIQLANDTNARLAEEIKEQRRIKNRITKLEDEIAGFESEIASLEKKFETSHSDEDLKKYDELKLSLEDKMQEWEEWMEKI